MGQLSILSLEYFTLEFSKIVLFLNWSIHGRARKLPLYKLPWYSNTSKHCTVVHVYCASIQLKYLIKMLTVSTIIHWKGDKKGFLILGYAVDEMTYGVDEMYYAVNEIFYAVN